MSQLTTTTPFVILHPVQLSDRSLIYNIETETGLTGTFLTHDDLELFIRHQIRKGIVLTIKTK